MKHTERTGTGLRKPGGTEMSRYRNGKSSAVCMEIRTGKRTSVQPGGTAGRAVLQRSRKKGALGI